MKRMFVFLLLGSFLSNAWAQNYYLELEHDLKMGVVFSYPLAIDGQFWGFASSTRPYSYYFDGNAWETVDIPAGTSLSRIRGIKTEEGGYCVSFNSSSGYSYLWNNERKDWDSFSSPVTNSSSTFVLSEDKIYICGNGLKQDTQAHLYLWDGEGNHYPLASYKQNSAMGMEDLYMIDENNGLLLAFLLGNTLEANKLLRYDGSDELQEVADLPIDKGRFWELHSRDGQIFFFATESGYLFRWSEIDQKLDLLHLFPETTAMNVLIHDNDHLFVYGRFEGRATVYHYQVSTGEMTTVDPRGIDIYRLKAGVYDEVTGNHYIVTNNGKICLIKEEEANSDQTLDLINRIRLAPNPVIDQLVLYFPEDIAQCRGLIYNSLGTQVLEFSISSTIETINLSSLNPGVYFLKVEAPGYYGAKKLIKN